MPPSISLFSRHSKRKFPLSPTAPALAWKLIQRMNGGASSGGSAPAPPMAAAAPSGSKGYAALMQRAHHPRQRQCHCSDSVGPMLLTLLSTRTLIPAVGLLQACRRLVVAVAVVAVAVKRHRCRSDLIFGCNILIFLQVPLLGNLC